MIKLKPLLLIKESYQDKLSDDERNDLAMSYFDIGQMNDEEIDNNSCWIWDQFNHQLTVKKGGTHSSNFGRKIINKVFRGWYDKSKNVISIVFPDYELRKFGNRRPDEDDIPEELYRKLISSFGKRKPRFIVFESKNSYLKKLITEIISLLKESGFQGEWWFQDGQAVYADGDVGDMNHEAYVIDALNRQILDYFGVDSSKFDRVPDITELGKYEPETLKEILEDIQDELTEEEKELISDGFVADAINSYLLRQPNLKDMVYYVQGRDKNGRTLDPREYALIHWGWQRVKGNTIQTQTLTTQDLSHIVSGLYEAYNDELEETNPENITDGNPDGEPTFDIEVMSTRSWYQGIPISVLEKKNPTALNPYRSRY